MQKQIEGTKTTGRYCNDGHKIAARTPGLESKNKPARKTSAGYEWIISMRQILGWGKPKLLILDKNATD
jgi:hypothetical protein